MKIKNNKFATAYNYYQTEKNSRPFSFTPSENTQKKLDSYATLNKSQKTSTLDFVFSLIR